MITCDDKQVIEYVMDIFDEYLEHYPDYKYRDRENIESRVKGIVTRHRTSQNVTQIQMLSTGQ